MIELKTAEEINKMAVTGEFVAETLASRTGFDPELPIRLSRPYATKPLAASNWLPKS